FYHRITFGHLEPVLDTLVWLRRETAVWAEITTLLIPGLNDGNDEIGRECDWILEHLGADVPLHFTAFHPDFKMLDRARTPAVTPRQRSVGSPWLRHLPRGKYTGRRRSPTFHTGATMRSGPKRYWSHRSRSLRSLRSRKTSGRAIGMPLAPASCAAATM